MTRPQDCARLRSGRHGRYFGPRQPAAPTWPARGLWRGSENGQREIAKRCETVQT